VKTCCRNDTGFPTKCFYLTQLLGGDGPNCHQVVSDQLPAVVVMSGVMAVVLLVLRNGAPLPSLCFLESHFGSIIGTHD